MRAAYLAALLLLSAHAAAAEKPKKVAIGPGSPKGALLIKIPARTIDHQLLFIRDGSSTEHMFWIRAAWKSQNDLFIVETLPPGRYQLEAVYQQGKWTGCLTTRTLKTTVEAGKIGYLGKLDARATLTGIARGAQANKHLTAGTFDWFFYRKDIAAPNLSDRGLDDLAGAKSFVRENMPDSTAEVTSAELQWGSYELSKPSGRANRCG